MADPAKAVVEANSSVKGFAIQVTDASGLPVPDVAVAMRLPEDGATGFFMDGAHSAVAYTDASGIARFAQVNWGATVGALTIRVTAAKGDLHAGALIEQTIVASSAATPLVQSPAVKITAPAATAAAPVTQVNGPAPGTPMSVSAVTSGTTARQSIPVTETAASAEPAVSIVNSGGDKSHSNRKWILLAVVAVGAGVGAAMALSGKGAASVAASPSVSIGTPTVSLGH